MSLKSDNQLHPSFFIGKIPVYGDLILAPMDGFCDQPFRSICRDLGSAVTYTEFINALDVPQHLPYIQRRISFSEQERPVGFQLYGSSADEIIPAAKILLAGHPDFFDLNLGCSERRVAGRGAGAGLLSYPDKIEGIIHQLKRLIDIPITAKIRLGSKKDRMNYSEIAKRLEDCGVSAIAVHGRTRDQRWREPALWDPIREIKIGLGIPVIGNGDVQAVDDIDRMFSQTRCDAVMIGRGAVGNPWIFSRIEKSSLSKSEILKMIAAHWDKVKDFYRGKNLQVTFMKHLKGYLSCSQFAGLDLKELLMEKRCAEEIIESLYKRFM